jgi:ubiquinone/menaquinone biosynthesis C-methylase UbiE
MKNILNEKPTTDLTGRLMFAVNFVSNNDIKDKKVLDIGCGYGWFELNALKRGVKEMAGIEISKEDLKTAKNSIKNKKVIFKVGGALEVPFENNYFDTVVAWEVIEHIPKTTEDRMFKEVFRVLKKNGVFYLSTPNNSFFSTTFDPAFWLIGHRHYTKHKLTQLGENAGFKKSETYIKGRWWGLASLLNLYISKWIFRRKPFFEKLFHDKEDQEYGLGEKGFMGIFAKYTK